MTERRIAVVNAGVSNPSTTRLLADRLVSAVEGDLTALGLAPVTKHVELRVHAHELVDHALTGFPAPGLRAALDDVIGADGVIMVTPIYMASFSGLFKLFADALADGALTGKPALIAATGGTLRHSLALDHAVRPLFAYLRAVVVPTGVYAAPEDWAGDAAAGTALGVRVQRAAAELSALVAARTVEPVVDPFDQPTPFEELLRGEGRG